MANPKGHNNSKKNSIIYAFANRDCNYSKQMVIALLEKDAEFELNFIDTQEGQEKFKGCNPYDLVPCIVDKGFCVYETSTVLTYIEDRLPFPELIPSYPIARAETYKIIYFIEKMMYPLLGNMEDGSQERIKLIEYFMAFDEILRSQAFFRSETFSIIECWMIPIVYELEKNGITIPMSSKGTNCYLDSIIKRASYVKCKNMFKHKTE